MIRTLGRSGPPNTMEIKHYLHCKKCEETCPAGLTYQDWADVEVGFTSYGLQVWCRRHKVNIAHLDFRGSRIVVNATSTGGMIWPVTH